MNKLGQAGILSVMLVIMTVIVMVIAIPAITTLVDEARDATHLDCSATGLSLGVSLTCTITDLYVFFYVGLILFGGLGILQIQRKFSKGK